MANSSLLGKKIKIDDNIMNHLFKIKKAYNGDKTTQGYSRLTNLLDTSEVSYEQLKRIKNFFDNYTGKKNSTEYLLNGGSVVKEWVERTLNNLRQDIKGKKQQMSNVGSQNEFNKSNPTKIQSPITNSHEKSNSSLRENNDLKVINNLINFIFENNNEIKTKTKCQTDKLFHRY